MLARIVIVICAVVCTAQAQKYTGPRPQKPDLPYLKHADNLVPTEVAKAREEKQKNNDILYVTEGAASSSKTPLASPIFIFQADKLNPDKLALYKVEVKNGNREILFGPKKQPKAIHLEVDRLVEKIYKLEVSDSLEPGEYLLTPEGSNQVFCFQVY
jgi:hypothetical protein